MDFEFESKAQNLYPELNDLSRKDLKQLKVSLEHQKIMVDIQIKSIKHELKRRKESDEIVSGIVGKVEEFFESSEKDRLTFNDLERLTFRFPDKIEKAVDKLIISGPYVKIKGGGIKRTS